MVPDDDGSLRCSHAARSQHLALVDRGRADARGCARRRRPGCRLHEEHHGPPLPAGVAGPASTRAGSLNTVELLRADQRQLDLLPRCTFPHPGTAVDCALSGGADSTALVALARMADLRVTAHHVHHGIRDRADHDVDAARDLADLLGAAFVLHRVEVTSGPNLEARARDARHAVLPTGTMTGHTADDQAETVLIRLMRGAGADGLGAMRPGPTKPILALRRHETHALCSAIGLPVVHDETNHDPRFVRNRVRHEIVPRLADVVGRDIVPLLTRSAELLRDDADLLTELAGSIDVTDARGLTAAAGPLARRAVRAWLTVDGYPPDAATVERVLAVARGDHRACEIGGGRRVERSGQRLRLIAPTHGPSPDNLGSPMDTDERSGQQG